LDELDDDDEELDDDEEEDDELEAIGALSELELLGPHGCVSLYLINIQVSWIM